MNADVEELNDEDDAPSVPAFANPKSDESPVVPLGFTGAQVVFGMPAGDIRIETASRIAGMLKTDIFACFEGQAFLQNWRNNDDGKFQRDLAAIWFNRKCREAGLWNDQRPKRSLGVWEGTDERSVVVHAGDAIWEGGENDDWVPVAKTLRRRTGPIYIRAPEHPRPVFPGATSGDLECLRQFLGRWQFEAIGKEGLTGADVVLGWIGGAILGAVAPFRGHCLLYGPPGAGKTTLMRLIHSILSAMSGEMLNDFTEAGFRNALANEARPVLLDEAEAATNGQPGAVEKALETLRRMSTGDGGRRRMGAIGGGSASASAVGAALLGAITPPRLSAADASRFVEVRIKPLGAAIAGTDDKLAEERAAAEALSPRILARVVRLAGRYRADVRQMKLSLGLAGLDPRAADLMAMLAAGRRLLTSDEALTEEAADREVWAWQPLIERRIRDDTSPNEGASCLAHLFAHETGYVRDGRRATVGELIAGEVKSGGDASGDQGGHAEHLRSLGLRVYVGPPDGGGPTEPWCWVANSHPGLTRIFAGTRWGDWKRALEFLDALGADHAPRIGKSPQRFGLGVKVRFLAVPLAPWLGDGPSAAPSRPVPPTVPDEDVEA